MTTVAGAVSALVIAGAFLLAAYALSVSIARTAHSLTRWSAAIVIAAWTAGVLFHILAALGLFTWMPALASALAVAGVTWGLAPRVSVRRAWQRDRMLLRALVGRVRRGRYRLVLMPIAAAMLFIAARALLLPPLAWDSFTYHLVKAAMWVQHGRFSLLEGPGPWAYYATMPAASEVLTAWTMLPLHDDTLVPLLDVALWIGVGAGAAALSRALGARGPIVWACGLFAMAIPTVRVEVGSGYVELCLLATLLCALAAGIETDADRPWLLAVCGAGLGVSAATKLPMYAITAVPVLFVAWLAINGGRQVRHAAIAGVAAYAIAVAPWLSAAARETGAPLSPVPATFGTVTLGVAPPETLWFMNRAAERGAPIVREAITLAKVFAPPVRRREQLGTLALAPLLMAALTWPALRTRWNRGTAMTAGVVLATIAVFYSPPFAVLRVHWPYTSSRFLLTAIVPLTVVAAAWGTRRRSSLTWALLLCAAFNLAVYSTYGSTWRSAGPALGILLLGTGIAAALVRVSSRSRAGGLLIAFLAATLGIAGLREVRDRLRADLMAREFTVGEFQTAWTRALPYVDNERASLRIAVTSGPFQNMDNWTAYPFMGRRLQNEVVYVSPSLDGQVLSFDNWDAPDLARNADKTTWLARLKARGVTHVITFNPPSIELGWMERDPANFERLEGSKGIWGLFRLRN